MIELISYVARVVSLSVRLFANRMAGHTLLKILTTFYLTSVRHAELYIKFVSFGILAVIILIVNLERRIAGLQAYVFTVLVLIYLKDALYASTRQH